MGAIQGDTTVRSHDGGGLEYSKDGGHTWTPVGSGTVNVSAPLSGDGSLGNPLVIAAATDSTPGAMSAADKTTFDNANLAGKQSVSVATATPTVAWGAKSDWLQITVTVNTTTILVTGLDLATDGGYDFDGRVIPDGTHEIDIKLNNSDATGTVWGVQSRVAGITFDQPNTLQISSGSLGAFPQDGQFFAKLRDCGAGNAKAWWANQFSNVNLQHAGNSTLTANVTSLSFNNVQSGSVINLRRIRPTVL